MGTHDTSARSSASSRKGAENHPRTGTRPAGVVHENARHTARFTVIGNHLAQHAELSLLAIGLAVHIQSLPGGAAVGIKSLAARFPEGTTRIAAALRELEVHGYLRRTRERTGSGRMVTRTVSCNQPGRTGGGEEETAEAPKPKPSTRRAEPKRHVEPKRRALPPVPQPAYPAPDLLATALGILAGLRREDPRLHVSAADAEHLAPGVAAWLERDLAPADVHRVLTFALPSEPLTRPAALLAHRLGAQLPPLPPFRARSEAPAVRHPLQNCDTCDRAYRAPEPGMCESCTPKTDVTGSHPCSLLV
ncbi:helix-turn-helix domain-containing protein [Streptomyces sp. NBC_00572]|uniref:helix-turn-helix domain-containing protein n=1 Tax=Streptomyces sp. NBC_00572 TaxID=2903664 RepID=UPI0022500912|nr:helix-turn-helix domain-containing protein [Streptomyces sp. NBC_00572]MCX4981968.1 helix-turn-helix domain-containing protein [Streptomyces sp. NBC_00572]